MEIFDDENVPLYTVGQVAEMLSLKQAFLRRIDDLQVVSPQRSAGRQRRYTRVEIRVIQQVVSMADEGMTMPAIRRIIELEQQLAELSRERDELAVRLQESAAERRRLSRQLLLLRQAGAGRAPSEPHPGGQPELPAKPAATWPRLRSKARTSAGRPPRRPAATARPASRRAPAALSRSPWPGRAAR